MICKIANVGLLFLRLIFTDRVGCVKNLKANYKE